MFSQCEYVRIQLFSLGISAESLLGSEEMTTKLNAQISVQFVNGGHSKRVTVLKDKFNKIVPKCSRFPILVFFCTVNTNFGVLNKLF